VPIEHDDAKARKFISSFFKFSEVHKFVASIDSISRTHFKNYWQAKIKLRYIL
jgi:hypothetical protein